MGGAIVTLVLMQVGKPKVTDFRDYMDRYEKGFGEPKVLLKPRVYKGC